MSEAKDELPPFLVEPLTLVGRAVRIEPLTMEHAADLHEAAAADPNGFRFMWTWTWSPSLEEFRESVKRVIDTSDWISFAIVDIPTGKAAGSTSYLDIRPPHRGIEIGATWIGAAHRGTHVNPENKYLLLRHAFETLGAIRLQLKTDGRNTHSQRAITKLGAKYEGVLRKHFVMPNGFIRDTVMYSITDEEWPAVKAGLEARLGYVP